MSVTCAGLFIANATHSAMQGDIGITILCGIGAMIMIAIAVFRIREK